MIPVVWLAYIDGENPRNKWDADLVEGLTSGSRFGHVSRLPSEGGAVVVLSGGVHSAPEYIAQLNEDLAPLGWVVLIVTADEQSLFPADDVRHPNMKVWLQTPGGVYRADEYLGYCNPARRRGVTPVRVPKDLDWSFIGQGNTQRRQQMLDVIRRDHPPLSNRSAGATTSGKMSELGDWSVTDRFAGGLPAEEYYRLLSRSRVVLCPSGPATPDSFRVWEAIECGAVPIVDGSCDRYSGFGYWGTVAPGAPRLTVIQNWGGLAGITEVVLSEWKARSNLLWSWWLQRRRQLRINLLRTVADLGGDPYNQLGVTVLVTSAPGPHHPSTTMLERAVNSARYYLPDAEVLLLLDGVHPSQAAHRTDYEEYIHRVLWLCEHEWTGVIPIVHGHHRHQTGMVAKALPLVQTPHVLFLEGDFELFGDIPVNGLLQLIDNGEVDVVRLTVNTAVEPLHLHMFIDQQPMMVRDLRTFDKVAFQRTWQWSSQPHLASTAYYRSIAGQHFREDNPTYVESVMSSVTSSRWVESGMLGWYQDRIALYTPTGDIQRVRHMDGRGGDPSYIV